MQIARMAGEGTLNADMVRQAEEALLAASNVEHAISYAREVLRLDEGVIAGMAETARQFALPFIRTLALAAPGLEASDANVMTVTFAATSSFTATGTVVRKSRVAEPTLPEWFTALPCGQRIMLMLIVLSVLFSFSLSQEAKDELVYLITVISGAALLASKVTKK